jgi:hypothetical protein
VSAKLTTGLFILLAFRYSHAQAQRNLVSQSDELVNKFKTTDTLFKLPYVDVDEWRESRYVTGIFMEALKVAVPGFRTIFRKKKITRDTFFNTLLLFQIAKMDPREEAARKIK